MKKLRDIASKPKMTADFVRVSDWEGAHENAKKVMDRFSKSEPIKKKVHWSTDPSYNWKRKK